MFYETQLLIPKNTPATAPVEAVLYIHPGAVKRISVFFPPGCVGLARCIIQYWERQIWPSNPDSFLSGDDISIVFSEDFEIIDPPFEFVVQGWNLDDTYPHTVTARVEILPNEKDITKILSNLAAPRTGITRETGEY